MTAFSLKRLVVAILLVLPVAAIPGEASSVPQGGSSSLSSAQSARALGPLPAAGRLQRIHDSRTKAVKMEEAARRRAEEERHQKAMANITQVYQTDPLSATAMEVAEGLYHETVKRDWVKKPVIFKEKKPDDVQPIGVDLNAAKNTFEAYQAYIDEVSGYREANAAYEADPTPDNAKARKEAELNRENLDSQGKAMKARAERFNRSKEKFLKGYQNLITSKSRLGRTVASLDSTVREAAADFKASSDWESDFYARLGESAKTKVKNNKLVKGTVAGGKKVGAWVSKAYGSTKTAVQNVGRRIANSSAVQKTVNYGKDLARTKLGQKVGTQAKAFAKSVNKENFNTGCNILSVAGKIKNFVAKGEGDIIDISLSVVSVIPTEKIPVAGPVCGVVQSIYSNAQTITAKLKAKNAAQESLVYSNRQARQAYANECVIALRRGGMSKTEAIAYFDNTSPDDLEKRLEALHRKNPKIKVPKLGLVSEEVKADDNALERGWEAVQALALAEVNTAKDALNFCGDLVRDSADILDSSWVIYQDAMGIAEHYDRERGQNEMLRNVLMAEGLNEKDVDRAIADNMNGKPNALRDMMRGVRDKKQAKLAEAERLLREQQEAFNEATRAMELDAARRASIHRLFAHLEYGDFGLYIEPNPVDIAGLDQDKDEETEALLRVRLDKGPEGDLYKSLIAIRDTLKVLNEGSLSVKVALRSHKTRKNAWGDWYIQPPQQEGKTPVEVVLSVKTVGSKSFNLSMTRTFNATIVAENSDLDKIVDAGPDAAMWAALKKVGFVRWSFGQPAFTEPGTGKLLPEGDGPWLTGSAPVTALAAQTMIADVNAMMKGLAPGMPDNQIQLIFTEDGRTVKSAVYRTGPMMVKAGPYTLSETGKGTYKYSLKCRDGRKVGVAFETNGRGAALVCSPRLRQWTEIELTDPWAASGQPAEPTMTMNKALEQGRQSIEKLTQQYSLEELGKMSAEDIQKILQGSASERKD